MSIINHLEKNIKKYDISITKLALNKGLEKEMNDFVLRAAANKLQPKDSVILSLISEEIDRKIAESKQRKERYNIHSKEKKSDFSSRPRVTFYKKCLCFERWIYRSK